MITGHVYPFSTVDHPVVKGPSTYLHAGASKTGWPHDQSTEDTFDLPAVPGRICRTPTPLETSEVTREYVAKYTSMGGAELVLITKSTYETIRPIAAFDTMADAQTAAEALNNHEGN